MRFNRSNPPIAARELTFIEHGAVGDAHLHHSLTNALQPFALWLAPSSAFGKTGCGETSWLIPLHGGKGGPLRCPICAGKWNAEHGRRRRTGRIAIRAVKAFLDAGGKYQDIDKLKFSATSGDLGVFGDHVVDQLGYMDGIARFDDADVELTSELLADVLRLTHPDCHPPERQELAHRVTQRLLALQPFVFPAPKPEPPTKLKPTPRSWLDDLEKDISSKKTARYPCGDCADTVPAYYCDACRTE